MVESFVLQVTTNVRAAILSVVIGIAYYILTLAGITANSVFAGLRDSHKKFIAPNEIGRYVFAATTWRGFAVSPLIFGFMVGFVNTKTFSLALVLLAFENGFFWRNLLETVQQRHAQSHAKQNTEKSAKNRKK